MNSAEQAARARGFNGFSHADLAEDVGIRKASIHHHFSTKAKLSVALMQRYSRTLENSCAEIDANHSTGGARLMAQTDVYRNALQGGKSLCLCVSFSTSRESLPDEVINEISAFRQMAINWLETAFLAKQKDDTIGAVTDPKAEAAATLPLFEGAQLAARAEETLTLFDNVLHLLVQRVN